VFLSFFARFVNNTAGSYKGLGMLSSDDGTGGLGEPANILPFSCFSIGMGMKDAAWEDRSGEFAERLRGLTSWSPHVQHH